jgi:hypothetical protein
VGLFRLKEIAMGKVKQIWIDEQERIMNSVFFEDENDDDMDIIEQANIAIAEEGYDFYVRHNIRF